MIDKNDDSMAVLEGQRYRRLRLQLFIWLAALCLVACQGTVALPTATRVAAAASPTWVVVTVPATLTATPSTPTPLLRTPVARFATATPLPPLATVTVSPSATALPEATLTVTVSLSSSPSPPFQQVVQLETEEIAGMWPAPDGTVWVATAAGLYAVTPGQVQRLSERRPGAVLGEDREGRIWVLFEEGETIAAYEAESWTFYGAEQGWEAAPATAFRGDEVVVDRLGGVWLALGRAGLRRLDPAEGSWQTLRAAEVRYVPPPSGEAGLFSYDSHLAFTDVALDRFGNIWIGACAVRVMDGGPLPLLLGEGQGVRWFDGEEWAGPGESDGRCVRDIEVDAEGAVWLAGRENDLWQGNVFVRYEPPSGRWVQQSVPESEASFEQNPRFVSDFWFDAGGRPWMHVERRGGATFPPDAIYYQEGDAWIPFLPLLPGKMAGSPDSGLWLLLEMRAGDLEQGVYHYEAGAFAPLSWPREQVDPATLTVDSSGRAWFSSRDGRSLWYYDGTSTQ